MAISLGRKPGAGQPDRGIRIPGIYAEWHRNAAHRDATWQIEEHYDPRFDDPEADWTARHAAYQAEIAEATAEGERLAEARIATGKPMIGTLLFLSRLTWGVSGVQQDVMYNVTSDDVVTVNLAATQRFQEQQVAPDGTPPVGCALRAQRAQQVSSGLERHRRRGESRPILNAT